MDHQGSRLLELRTPALLERTGSEGELEERRRSQLVDWVRVLAREYLERRFFDHPRVRVLLPELETAVARGELPATRAVELLIEVFEKPHG